jgi:hypothetical protein
VGPEVVLRSDGGGKVPAAPHPIGRRCGSPAILELLRLVPPNVMARAVPANGTLGLACHCQPDGRFVVSAWTWSPAGWSGSTCRPTRDKLEHLRVPATTGAVATQRPALLPTSRGRHDPSHAGVPAATRGPQPVAAASKRSWS